MQPPLKGIIPPMVTPLLENGDLDIPGLNRLIEHILGGGVHGLFLLGTTGEGTSLPHPMRKRLVTEACAQVAKRVPVLVCITDTSFGESIELARHAYDAGADILVVAAPYYLPISQGEMQDYLEMLAPALPLPFLLYNMPSCTNLELSLETVRRGKELGAIGIKDSSGDRAYLTSLLQEFSSDPEFSIITGSELLLPDTIGQGGHGAVAGGANFFPELFVSLYEASVANDTSKIAALLEIVVHIDNTLYALGDHLSKYIKGTKGTLAAMGICNDYVAPPLRRFDGPERAKLQGYLDGFPSVTDFISVK